MLKPESATALGKIVNSFSLKKNFQKSHLCIERKQKSWGNINYKGYAKKGRDLIDDAELMLENKNKDLVRRLLSGLIKKKKYADLDLPLVFCFIFCTKIESLELFRWRFEFYYWLLEAKGLLDHPISLQVKATYRRWKKKTSEENRERVKLEKRSLKRYPQKKFASDRTSSPAVPFCRWRKWDSKTVFQGHPLMINGKTGNTVWIFGFLFLQYSHYMFNI